MLTIQLLKPGRDTMDLLSDRNLQSRHQIWRQTPNLVPWEKSRMSNGAVLVEIQPEFWYMERQNAFPKNVFSRFQKHKHVQRVFNTLTYNVLLGIRSATELLLQYNRKMRPT